MRSWSLSEELYRSAHQWPRISLFFLIGCLVGWMISWIFPPTYRASATIYVALNPYRTYEDSNFLANVKPEYSNLDDYKNWQMGQLNAAVYLDEIVQVTLDQLKEENPTWQSMDAKQLRALLTAEWRSAGKWSLVAENRDAALATQVAKTWSEVVFEKVNSAVDSARDMISTDNEMRATAENLNQAQSRLLQLQSTQNLLEEWVGAAQDLPVEELVESSERRQIINEVTSLAQLGPGWNELMNNQPDENTSRSAMINWIEQAISVLHTETQNLEESIANFEQAQADLEGQYADQFKLSLGLSPNLDVEQIEVVPAERVRPTGLMTLIGGLCGLLLWILIELVRITNQAKRNEQEKSDLATG